MNQRWREPIKADADETYAMSERGAERTIRWHVNGTTEEQHEAADRMGKGLACSQCLATFPAPPSRETLPFFRELRYEPDWMRDAALSRVARGQCPMCGSEVSAEMFAATFEGEEERWGER